MIVMFETKSLAVCEDKPTVVETLTTASKIVDANGKVWVEVETKKASYARPIAVQYFTVRDLQALGKIAADIAKGGAE